VEERQRWTRLQSSVAEKLGVGVMAVFLLFSRLFHEASIFSNVRLVTELPFGILMSEKHNITEMELLFNLQPYKATNEASTVALVSTIETQATFVQT
jgi:hypothetical protein